MVKYHNIDPQIGSYVNSEIYLVFLRKVKDMDKEALMKNVSNIDGVKGAMLVSKDGLVLANSMPDSVDPNLVSAVLSSMFNNIDVQSKRMQKGTLRRFSIETEDETLTLTEAGVGNDSLLVFSQSVKDLDLDFLNGKLDEITKV